MCVACFAQIPYLQAEQFIVIIVYLKKRNPRKMTEPHTYRICGKYTREELERMRTIQKRHGYTTTEIFFSKETGRLSFYYSKATINGKSILE